MSSINQVTPQVPYDLSASDLIRSVADELNIPITTVETVLSSLTSVCSGFVRRGYSFALSDDVFFRVGFVGQALVSSGMVVPRAVLHRAVVEDTGISKPVVDGILDRCMALMVSHYLNGSGSSIYGLLRFYPKATLSYNRVSYGSMIQNAKEDNNYRIQLVLSQRIRNYQFN